jgi:hypothetical protein
MGDREFLLAHSLEMPLSLGNTARSDNWPL